MKDLKPGDASVYGTQKTLKEAIEGYKIFPSTSEFYAKTLDLFLKRIKDNANDKDIILDIGCSFGAVCIQISKIYREQGLKFRLIGIDLEAQQIKNAKEYARQEGFSEMEFHVCDGRNIGDLLRKHGIKPTKIVSMYAFHHIPDKGDDLLQDKIDVLKQAKENSNHAILVIGDILLPYSFLSENYARHETDWIPQRIAAANKVSKHAGFLETNAHEGIRLRENEYPITTEEMKNVLKDSGWSVVSFDIIDKYNDAVIVANS